MYFLKLIIRNNYCYCCAVQSAVAVCPS